jgi:general secretion pathway protein D
VITVRYASRWLGAACALLGASAIPAQQRPARPAAVSDTVRLDFQDADIRAVITALATAGGVNVAYGDIPPKKVTLHLNEGARPSELRAILRNVAIANGLRVVEDSGLLMIDAPPAPPPARAGASFAGTELFVYRLRHANATRLSYVLQSIFATSGTAQRAPTGGPSPPSPAPSPAGSPFENSLIRPGPMGAGSRLNTAGGSGARFTPQPGQISVPGLPVAQQGQSSGGAEGPSLVIVPDDATNSLIVRASPADWEVIRSTIEAVDLRPLQVLIEVMIVEVRRNDDLEIGVSADVSGRTRGRNPVRSTASLRSRTDTGATTSFIHRLMRNGTVDIDVALSALRTRGSVRVLSLPIILAENNRESALVVGSEQPFIQSFRTFATDNSATDQIVQYQQVGTILNILPTINLDGYVNLQVYQEISAATPQVQFNAPVITNRNATASVFVKNGQTVVVGGLTNTEQQKSRSGIPVLSDLPALGALFGKTTETTARTELYLFLTPHVVTSDADAELMREEVLRRSNMMKQIPLDSVRLIDPKGRRP